jgi:protein-L-isoaspartate(D-aspartate) O-methyltransferase
MRPDFNGIGMTSQRTRDRLVKNLQSEGIKDSRVLQVIREIPRHIFVDEALASRAYENTALPIGHGQTISQPYIVARMTEAVLGDKWPKKVLEIGTGCGYQTAVLARLVQAVFTIERIHALQKRARERISALGIRNVRFRVGDGSAGWIDNAPFDGIIVTAAPVGIPEALVEQLAVGARLVIPVGGDQVQRLLMVTRQNGERTEEFLDYVSFVPMVGGTG